MVGFKVNANEEIYASSNTARKDEKKNGTFNNKNYQCEGHSCDRRQFGRRLRSALQDGPQHDQRHKPKNVKFNDNIRINNMFIQLAHAT